MFSGLFGYSFSGSRLFSGSRALSRKKPATIRQQPIARATNSKKPATIRQQPIARATNSQQPLAILRGRCREAGRSGRAAFRQHAKPYSDTFQSTETTGGSEIHGVESLKRGDGIRFSDFSSTLKRNARFWHKWPSGLTGGGGYAALGRCRRV